MLSINFGGYKFGVSVTTIATLSLMLGDSIAQAQIASDGTTDTQVQQLENNSTVTGGTQNGGNLFHSFKQFSLDTGEVANFDHDLKVENIFSRVTGGLISDLDGLIKTQGDANLFFLNPAGVIFGANAQLDVGGSFVVSTGDRFIFADGTEFGTGNLQPEPLLTISSPVGLQYGINPGEIAVLPNTARVSRDSSGLSINPGKTLALLGGDVSISRNSLNAQTSKIEISGVRSGTVAIIDNPQGWQFNYDRVKQLGNVSLSNSALIINNSGISNFRGARIDLSAGSAIINAVTVGEASSEISLEASESINLNQGSLLSQIGQQGSNAQTSNTGMGGDISITAPKILFDNGSIVSAATLNQEAGGSISINAAETFSLSSSAAQNPSIITTSTDGSGNGGDIEIDTTNFIVRDGSQIQAFGGSQGAGGQIKVNASDTVDIAGTGIFRSQNPITGELLETVFKSGFSASTGSENDPISKQFQGNSGNLIINTPNLNLSDRGQISVSNFGLGNGGDIQINTANFNLQSESNIVANTFSGNGGDIRIFATDALTLDQKSAISTAADNNGNGGRINLTTDSLLLLDTNRISADANQGSGGKIAINTQILIADPQSQITANSLVNQKQGVVKIETLDLDSRLQTKRRSPSPIKAENYIQQGCGAGEYLANNQFRNVGRGGITNNPLQETNARETLEDLGTHKQVSMNDGKISYKHSNKATSKPQAISEAQSWIVNQQGKVELIAPNSKAVSQIACKNIR